MKAVDTNVLVRVIARDDEGQAIAAETLLKAGGILILPSVLLETEWVLRSRYRFDRDRIVVGLTKVCGLQGAYVPHGEAVAAAIARFAEGRDFADALHVELAGELGAEQFVTFDKGVASAPGVAIELLASSGQPDD